MDVEAAVAEDRLGRRKSAAIQQREALNSIAQVKAETELR
jgi:hypothetical protein